MENQLAQQVRRAGVTDPIAAARRYDYADAFEVRLPRPDPYPPEAWVRAGLEATPKVVDRIVGLLGFSEAPASSPDHVSGFRIVESGPEVVHLETSLPLIHVVMVGGATSGRRAGRSRPLSATSGRCSADSSLRSSAWGIGAWCRGSSRARSRRGDRGGDADTERAPRGR